jgi:hypothetical protein
MLQSVSNKKERERESKYKNLLLVNCCFVQEVMVACRICKFENTSMCSICSVISKVVRPTK